MNIPQQRLVYFSTTVESGSLRKAAARLGIAPSAVSRQITLLEQALDAPLLERTPRGIRPTSVGEMVLDYCRRRQMLEDEFVAGLETYQRMETGTLSLVIGEGFVTDLIGRPLKAFTERYPGIRLDIQLAGTDDIIEAVVEDRAHIGLMFHERVHPRIRFWHSSRQPLLLILPPDHPLAGDDTPLSFEAIADTPLAAWRPGHGIRTLVDQAFAEAGRHPCIALETNSMAVLRQSVVAGLAVTLLPRFAATRELDDGSLVARSVAAAPFQNSQAHMITCVQRRLPKAGLALLRHLRRWMQAFRTPG